ncbi:hypothetical protein [Nonomuraea longicatena]|uniref:Uncharacterized protein n=1 Tax=Nonomuraea longicatena TaxID=83682 RepID=A0ABN1PW52_9ACTN
MTIFEERVAALRTAAQDGDAEAAREYGRLQLFEFYEQVESTGELVWPAEPWLRAAVAARPDDMLARVLLGSLLVTQVVELRESLVYLEYFIGGFGEETQEEANARRAEEAESLLKGIPETAPEAATAAACLETLRKTLAEEAEERHEDDSAPFPYDYHLIETESWGGSAYLALRLVGTDPDELRWACGRWLATTDGFGPETLTSYSRGEKIGETAIEVGPDQTVDWTGVSFPDLPGVPLPPGHPVPQARVFYGFSGEEG